MKNLIIGLIVGLIIGSLVGQFYIIYRIFGSFMLHSSFCELQNICQLK